jgi:peroxiredoxin
MASAGSSRIPDFGEPAPFFTAETDGVPNYSFEVAAGRWIVLQVFGSLSSAASADGHAEVMRRRALFNDVDASFFGVSVDQSDRFLRGLSNDGALRYFWDFDQAISRLWGLNDGLHLRPAVFLIDRAFRIVTAEPIEQTAQVLDRLEAALSAEALQAELPFAPVLTLPNVFEPAFCAELIAYFEALGGTPSGFAMDVNGLTTDLIDSRFKRRLDVFIAHETLAAAARERLKTRLIPMVRRAFGWQATEIERDLICRYDADDQGFFSAHRDDVTAGTAHRKFAVTINLNTEDYEGGRLRFPEFGRRTYAPPTGGATVFCCSLLHEVTPVTRGRRYCFVPFLYDADGVRLRRANLARVANTAHRARPKGDRHR